MCAEDSQDMVEGHRLALLARWLPYMLAGALRWCTAVCRVQDTACRRIVVTHGTDTLIQV